MLTDLINMPPIWSMLIVSIIALTSAVLFLWNENKGLKEKNKETDSVVNKVETLTTVLNTVVINQKDVGTTVDAVLKGQQNVMPYIDSIVKKEVEIFNSLEKLIDQVRHIDQIDILNVTIKENFGKLERKLDELNTDNSKTHSSVRDTLYNLVSDTRNQYQHVSDLIDKLERSIDSAHRDVSGLGATINTFIASLPFAMNKNLKD